MIGHILILLLPNMFGIQIPTVLNIHQANLEGEVHGLCYSLYFLNFNKNVLLLFQGHLVSSLVFVTKFKTE